MHALARCSQVLYDKEMLDNAKVVHELRKRAKPIVTEQWLQAATELQWVHFERQYTVVYHRAFMRLEFQSELPLAFFEPLAELPMMGVVAGVNALFRVLRYTLYDCCRAEILLLLEASFKQICFSHWLNCVSLNSQPYCPITTRFVRDHAHLPLAQILERARQE